ncbi:FkbM family methyltransferase [Gammaproteobacteria bacterium]|nr:FkbM family methyltransferase [Gammaproteobacteria bacterium]
MNLSFPINYAPPKDWARWFLEENFPRTLLNYRIFRKVGFEPEIALLPMLCDPKKASLDIGANIGVFTWHLLKHSRSILAFEPNPRLCNLLLRTFGSSIDIHQIALSNLRGSSKLSFPGNSHALGSLHTVQGHLPGGEDDHLTNFTVKTRPLDDLGMPPIGFIKIDVEGHELNVLKGAQQTILRNRPMLLIEIEERHSPEALKSAEEMLAGWGYAGRFLLDNTLLPLSNFDPARHQNSNNIDHNGQRLGPYINNFIFSPEA